MKLHPPQSVQQVAELIGCKYIGADDHLVTGINEIHRVEQGDLVFVDHPKYYKKALDSAASTILINEEVECPKGKALIISKRPFDDYNKLTQHFGPFRIPRQSIDPSSKIAPTAILGPNVVIGNNVKIGEHSVIHAGVVIYGNTTIGSRVEIGANSTLGSPGFYFKKKESGYEQMHSCGEVIIEDGVRIGTGCSIDRGVSSATRIGTGSCLDNQVHIGHDTLVGKNCLIAAQVGIAGCVTIGDWVTLWGQVGIPSGLTVGDRATLLGKTAISKSVEGGKTYLGSPAKEAREKFKELVLMGRLEELFEKKT